MIKLLKFLKSTAILLLALRYGGVAAGFLIQLILARILTPDSLGLFFAAFSLAALASSIASFGYPEIAPRYISRYQARDRQNTLLGFIKQSHRDMLFGCLAISCVVIIGSLIWPNASDKERLVFLMTAIWLPFLAYIEFNSWIALSLRRFLLAYGPETFLMPVIFLLMITAIFFLDLEIEVFVLVIAYVVITSTLTILHWLYLRTLLPRMKKTEIKPIDYRMKKRWRRESILQIPVSIYTALFADLAVLITALFLPNSELAAFTIALKISMLFGFAVQVTHNIIIPDLADAVAERKYQQTKETIRAAALLPIVITAIGLVAATLFGDRILTIFHPSFAIAHNLLIILIGCQFLRALAGPTVQLLTIIGAQLQNAWICIASIVFLVGANLILIPALGTIGAAWSIFITWIFWLFVSAITLKNLTGLRCDILAIGLFSRAKVIS